MKISLVQYSTILASNNFNKTIQIITSCKNSDIVVFPELWLHGYLLMDSAFEEALTIKEFKIFKKLSRQYKVDIVFGAVLNDCNKIYNSAIYIQNGDIIHIHYKNYLPNYGMFEEKRFFANGNTIDIFDTHFGKSIILICEDLWKLKDANKIDFSLLDNIFVLANSPTRGFLNNGILDIQQQWEKKLYDLSKKTDANIFFVNRVGFEDGVGFWGGSLAISNKNIIKKASLFKENILDIDI